MSGLSIHSLIQLLILNHSLGSNSANSPPQPGANPVDQAALPQGAEQIFVMSQNISDTQKEDLAWQQYGLWEMLPEGTRSLLVEPVLQVRDRSANEMEETEGFVLLASNIGYAYIDKDRAWIRAVANKFGDITGTAVGTFMSKKGAGVHIK